MAASAPTGRLWLTWLALLALAGLTFGLSFLPLGPLGPAAALLVATAKGALVLLFFMELVETRGSVRVALLVALALLALLLALSITDVESRRPPALPPALTTGPHRVRAPSDSRAAPAHLSDRPAVTGPLDAPPGPTARRIDRIEREEDPWRRPRATSWWSACTSGASAASTATRGTGSTG
jgi:cytochrome c oxidase subunit 4